MFDKRNFLSVFLSKYLLVVSVSLIAVISIGKVVGYYFYYDDFFLFYALQFPNDKNSIFLSPDASAYRFIQPFFAPLFRIFGYEPMGYFIISIILFLITIWVLYLFLENFFSENKNLAVFSSLIMASGYVGVEAFTWNMGAGPNNTLFIAFSLLVLLFVLLYIKKKKKISLFGIIFTFIFTVYFFQFRAFLLFLWMVLLILLLRFQKKSLSKQFIVLLGVLAFIGLGLYKESFGFSKTQGMHLDLSATRFLQIYLRNLANLFFPSELLQGIAQKSNINLSEIELFSGILSIIILLLSPLIAFVKKARESALILFFSANVILSLLLLHIVIAFTVNAPDVWYSAHRFYFVIVPFLSGFFGSILIVIYKKSRPVALSFLTILLLTHATLSNIVIQTRWANAISQIKYFYTTIHSEIPHLDKNSVLLIEQGNPTPMSIFVSARAADGFAGLAGFYGMTVGQLNLARSPEEAVEMLKNLGVSEDHLYALYYKHDALINMTQQARDILAKGKTHKFGNAQGEVVEFANLSLPASTPLYGSLQLTLVPDVSNINMLQRLDQIKVEHPETYFPLLIEQEDFRKSMSASSSNEPLGDEHAVLNITDGDYATTWIPKEWGNSGASVIVDLGLLRKVDRIVWSSSRTASWYVRMPSEYTIEVSKDGKEFIKVSTTKDAPILKSGEYFVESLPEQNLRFIKITINKTRGGLTPAIDEVEVFDKNADTINLSNYFTVKQNPQAYLANALIAEQYLGKVLHNKITAEIDWRVDGNTDYPVGQSIVISQNAGEKQSIHVLLPILGQELKSIRIRPTNFPAKLKVENFEVVYPKLNEVSKPK